MSILPPSPGIYKITCEPTGKIYVGSTTDLRKRKGWHWGDLQQGRHHNRHLQNAWNKHGKGAFTFDVLEMVMFVEYLHEREQYWLDYYQASNPRKGFNFGKVARAPWLGRSHTEETRQKLRDGARSRITPDTISNFCEKASEWHGSATGRLWHGRHAQRFWDERSQVEKQCTHCGATYKTRDVSGTGRFCSDRCKNRARYASGAIHEDRICAQCGTTFRTNKYGRARCCSAKCATLSRSRADDGTFV